MALQHRSQCTDCNTSRKWDTNRIYGFVSKIISEDEFLKMTK